MEPDQTYDVKIFGSPKWAKTIVDAQPVSHSLSTKETE